MNIMERTVAEIFFITKQAVAWKELISKWEDFPLQNFKIKLN